MEAMTRPAFASDRMRRVAATLSPNRNSVATNSSDGNVENSRGRCMKKVSSRINSAKEKLAISRKSSNPALDNELDGKEFLVEDYWENVDGRSWMKCDGGLCNWSKGFQP